MKQSKILILFNLIVKISVYFYYKKIEKMKRKIYNLKKHSLKHTHPNVTRTKTSRIALLIYYVLSFF